MFFILKFIVFIVFIFFIYFHFLPYGEIKFISGDYEVDTTYALVAVAVVLFVLFIAYMSQIVRFLVNLPSSIINKFKNTKKQRANKVLQQILFYKDSNNAHAAKELFKKNESLLTSQKSSFVEVTRFKLFAAELTTHKKNQIFYNLAQDNSNVDFVYREFILPNFLAANIADLEKFADKFSAKNTSFILVELHIHLLKSELEKAEKQLKLIKSSELSELNINDVRANILVEKAKNINENKHPKDVADLIINAFNKSSLNQSLYLFILTVNKKTVNLNKLSLMLEKAWENSPLSRYLNLYLNINGDGSQGEMLNCCERLLSINSSDHAKQSVACEYLLYGYKKKAEQILIDVDKSRYLPSLLNAFTFREAISHEAKADKLETFRKIVIGSDV